MTNENPMQEALDAAHATLRITEDQLADLRADYARLRQENRALRITIRNMNAGRQFSGRPLAPELLAGPGDAVWSSGLVGGRAVENVNLPSVQDT